VNPTVLSVGAELILSLVAGDKTTGGIFNDNERIILKPFMNYLIRIENVSGGSASVALAVKISED
jgi:hypothetical protein